MKEKPRPASSKRVKRRPGRADTMDLLTQRERCSGMSPSHRNNRTRYLRSRATSMAWGLCRTPVWRPAPDARAAATVPAPAESTVYIDAIERGALPRASGRRCRRAFSKASLLAPTARSVHEFHKLLRRKLIKDVRHALGQVFCFTTLQGHCIPKLEMRAHAQQHDFLAEPGGAA